jgi:hypothetical protein
LRSTSEIYPQIMRGGESGEDRVSNRESNEGQTFDDRDGGEEVNARIG